MIRLGMLFIPIKIIHPEAILPAYIHNNIKASENRAKIIVHC
jgi:hypothetical protein